MIKQAIGAIVLIATLLYAASVAGDYIGRKTAHILSPLMSHQSLVWHQLALRSNQDIEDAEAYQADVAEFEQD